MKTNEKLERYQRQLLLPEVGTLGQEKFKNSKILLVGAGGLGSAAAFYLAAAGIGLLGIVDDDIVEKSNLNRQILHLPDTIGKPKVNSAQATLNAFNPDINIKTYPLKFAPEKQFEDLIKKYDLVLDCTDNYETRYAINQVCINQRTPWVYGAVSEFEGQVMTIIPGETPCYRCLYPSAPVVSKEVAAVIGIIPGFIGILQASEALKYLLNTGKLLSGRFLHVDLKDMYFDMLTVNRNDQCPACKNLFNYNG